MEMFVQTWPNVPLLQFYFERGLRRQNQSWSFWKGKNKPKTQSFDYRLLNTHHTTILKEKNLD